METDLIQELAVYLDCAALEGREVERLTVRVPDLSLTDAYLIQDTGLALRLSRGEKPIGFKMGLTSQAKRQQMNLHDPIYGVLTDRMEISEGEIFHLKGKIHPKIEPEVAFFIGRTLQGNLSPSEVFDACTGVCAAMEILDSRFLNFKYFSLPDVVADNCSSAYFILSKKIVDPKTIDLENLEMVMTVDGAPVQKGISRDISGNPFQSVLQLCEMLTKRGLSLPAGSVILAGAATQAVPLIAGTEVALSVQELGRFSLSIKP